MNKPEKLILDYSKWRSGGDDENKVGEGRVALLNKRGFMCCLGQWCQQLGVKDENLLDNGEPQELNQGIKPFVSNENELYEEPCYKNTRLSDKAIAINDNPETTPEQKIEELTELLMKEGILLEVINKPQQEHDRH
jgi:hypothetical protein